MRAAGWLAFAVLAAGAWVDRTRAFDRWVISLLRARLGTLAGDLTLVDADIRWLDRSLVLHGLSLDLDRDEVFAAEVRIALGARSGRIVVERAEWLGGQLIVSRALLTALEGRPAPAEPPDGAARRVPALVVEGLDVSIETPRYGDVDVGRVAATLTADRDGTPRIVGRLVPSSSRARDAGAIWISGTLLPDGTLEARGTGRDLRLSSRDLPPGAPFDDLRRFSPEMTFDFEGRGRLAPGESVLPELALRFRVADGRLLLPQLDEPADRPLEDVEIRAEASFRPGRPASLWSRDAWTVAATLEAAWGGSAWRGGLRAGPTSLGDASAEAWLRASDLPLGEDLLELGGQAPDLVELVRMLAPEGRADVALGLRLPADWTARDGIARIEHAIAVTADGEASLAYHGQVSREREKRDEGFPLRVGAVEGLVTWTYHPADEYPVQLGLHDLTGRHRGGEVRVRGSLHEIPGHMIGATREERRARRPFFPSLFHLAIESEGLAVDAELEEAFEGLSGVRPMGEIFDVWGPEGGALDLRLQLWRVPSRPDLAVDVDLAIDAVDFTWQELPLPLAGARGRLRVLYDGGGGELGRNVVSIAAAGRSPASHGTVRVTGRSQSEGAGRSIGAFRIEAGEVNTRSPDLREALRVAQPAVLTAIDAAGVTGFVDVTVESSDPLPRGGTRTTSVVTTREEGARLQPEAFGTPTHGVQGRVVVSSEAPPRPREAVGDAPDGAAAAEPAEARSEGHAVLQGAWDDASVPVALAARVTLAAGAPTVLETAGAGISITDRGVLGSIADAVRRKGESGDLLDPELLDIDGRFDFSARFELPAERGGAPGPSEIEVEARLDRLGFGEKRLLADVSAHFRLLEPSGEWIGERISAKLGSTPVRITNLRYAPIEDGSRLRLDIAASDVPLDREHLRLFVAPETLDRLLDDLGLFGQVDIAGAALAFDRRDDGSTAMRFDGTLDVDELTVRLGVPLELSGVEGVDVAIRLEGERMRAHASVRGLDGRLAGRSIEETDVELTFVEPRLTVGMDGRFERGTIASTGGSGARFFAMDLVPPFPFDLAARMRDVDVGQFLRGALNSDFANEGRMDLDLRLHGDVEHLCGLAGDGRMRVSETRLWAIPAFQALFERLGFPTTAVFNRIDADFRIGGGMLWIDRMRADSDLVSVVGSGSIDFEGSLATDLEVRYGLVDRLGPFTRLLYAIQNSLLRVAVRGTMERPVVVLRGLFSQFFKPADARDRLPLPGFSELPARF